MKNRFWLVLLPLACGVSSLLITDGAVRRVPIGRPVIAANGRAAASQPAPLISSVSDRATASTLNSAPPQTHEDLSKQRLAADIFSGPPAFEPNVGQASADTQFVVRNAKMSLALTSDGISVAVPSRADPNRQLSPLKIHVRGSAPMMWEGKDPAPGETNYFVGNDPKKWRTHVPHFGRVETTNEHGVNLAIHGNGQRQNKDEGVEYDVLTSPGMDPSKLRFELTGAKNVRVERSGDLVMSVSGREIRMGAPAVYEQVASTTTDTHKKATSGTHSHKSTSTSTHSHPRGSTPRRSSGSSSNAEHRRVRESMHDDPHSPRKRKPRTALPPPLGGSTTAPKTPRTRTPKAQPPSQQSQGTQSGQRIEGGYILEADGSVGLWVGKHDPRASLLIDPSLSVTYETFLGGTGSDSVTSIALDAAGNVYLAGTTTSSPSFPESANTANGASSANSQFFIAKVAFSGGVGTPQYLTFIGGSDSQAGGQIAVDPSGNAAILGVTTSADYPVTDGSTPTTGLTGGKGNDLIVSEVDPTGANLIFSTLFGGSGTESLNAANSPSGVALTTSENIPAAEGGIAIDASGNVYVASDTTSQDLCLGPQTSFQPTFGGVGHQDGFIAEFQPQNIASGTAALAYCSYLDTKADNQVAIGGVAVDNQSPANVYVAGLTAYNPGNNTSFPYFPTQNPLQSAYGGGASDAFVMKIAPLNAGASDLLYATLLGGTGMDEALAIAVDTQIPANAYVVGATQSPNFTEKPPTPTVPPSLHPASPSGPQPPTNAFLAVVASAPATSQPSLKYLTYFGGSAADAAQSVVAPFANQVFVGGTATSADFGWHDNIQALNGTSDAFLAKLDTSQSGTSSPLYATPLGGTMFATTSPVQALGNGIAADGQGNVFVAGTTTAGDFPTAVTTSGTINGFQPVCESCTESPALPDAFLVAMQEGTQPQPALAFDRSLLTTAQGVPVNGGTATGFFKIMNSGDADLLLDPNQPVAVGGSNASDFSVAPLTCPQPITPGSSCIGQANFNPTIAGNESAVIAISDNAPGSPQLLEVTGNSVGPLLVSPLGFAFQPTPINAVSLPLTVTVTAGVAVQMLSFTGGDQRPFVIFNNGCPGFLEQGMSCTISYTFRPTTAGTFQANVNLTYQVNGQPASENLPMTGTAVPVAPVPIVGPSQLTFGSEPIGGRSAQQTVSLSNRGSAPLGLTSGIAFAGANAADFSETNNCPNALPVLGICTISVTFAPQSSGAKTAALTISDNASGSPQTVALSGTAIAPPQIQITPTAVNFGSSGIGATSTATLITISNPGQTTLGLSSITIAGANANDFAIATNSCTGTLPPSQSSNCALGVTFTPSASGPRSAFLSVSDNVAGSPQTIPLSGTGQQASAAISPTSITFAGQAPGVTSAPQTVTITSTGPVQPLSVSVNFAGPNATDFHETNTCTNSVTTSCTVTLTFTPSCTNGSATRTATLTIQDNSATPSVQIPVTGTVTGNFCLGTANISLTQTVAAGTTAIYPEIPITAVGSFSGPVSLGCTSAPTGPTCSFAPSATINVSPNVPGQFEVEAATTSSAKPAPQSTWPKIDPQREIFATLAVLAALLFWLARRQTRVRRRLAFAVPAFVFLAVTLAACGGGGVTSTAVSTTIGTQTYTLTVTATAGAQTQAFNLTLNVTN